jgi:hypothetical protein
MLLDLSLEFVFEVNLKLLLLSQPGPLELAAHFVVCQ